MKLLIAICSIFAMNFAHAELGFVESHFSSGENGDNRVHLYLQNNCYQEAYVATKTLNPNNIWETKGFTRLFPGQIIYLTDMKADFYYLHAISGDRRITWQGPHWIELQGRFLPSLMVNLPRQYRGNWTTVLYCN